MTLSLLWIPATLLACLAQTARNAMQRHLTEALGTLGATQVRFLYGLPFALLFLALVAAHGNTLPPAPTTWFLAYTALGAVAQIAATALMLAAMRERSFGVAIAYTKTEPVQVAIFGLVLLGESLGWLGAAAVLIATCGVVLVSWQPGFGRDMASWRPALLGLAAGAGFALSAVAFRGGLLSLESGHAVLRASTGLAWSLAMQTTLLLLWLGVFHRPALTGSLRLWRPSLFAGFMGAAASQFWFIGFALTAAANVRTLALVEVVLAYVVSRRVFAEQVARRESVGLILIVAGIGLLLAT